MKRQIENIGKEEFDDAVLDTANNGLIRISKLSEKLEITIEETKLLLKLFDWMD